MFLRLKERMLGRWENLKPLHKNIIIVLISTFVLPFSLMYFSFVLINIFGMGLEAALTTSIAIVVAVFTTISEASYAKVKEIIAEKKKLGIKHANFLVEFWKYSKIGCILFVFVLLTNFLFLVPFGPFSFIEELTGSWIYVLSISIFGWFFGKLFRYVIKLDLQPIQAELQPIQAELQAILDQLKEALANTSTKAELIQLSKILGQLPENERLQIIGIPERTKFLEMSKRIPEDKLCSPITELSYNSTESDNSELKQSIEAKSSAIFALAVVWIASKEEERNEMLKHSEPLTFIYAKKSLS